MTVQEALETLGVSVEASADEVRRAYLRLLKQHKPEVDPEGFRRLREAYELVGTRSSATVRRVVARPRAAPIEQPPAPPLPPAPPVPEAEEHKEKKPEPALPPREEVNWSALASEALELASRGETAPALELLDDLVTLCEQDSRAVEWLVPEISQSLLHLANHGDLEGANEIGDRLAVLVSRRGGLRISQNVVSWNLVREILGLPAAFPAPARRVMLAALLAGDPALACEDLRKLYRQDRRVINQAQALLPPGSMLFNLYHHFLEELVTPRSVSKPPQQPVASYTPSWLSRMHPLAVTAIVLSTLQLLLRFIGGSGPTALPPPRKSDIQVSEEVLRYNDLLRQTCKGAVSTHSLCSDYGSLVAALLDENCAATRAAAKNLSTWAEPQAATDTSSPHPPAVHPSPSGPLRESIPALLALAYLSCPAPATGEKPASPDSQPNQPWTPT